MAAVSQFATPTVRVNSTIDGFARDDDGDDDERDDDGGDGGDDDGGGGGDDGDNDGDNDGKDDDAEDGATQNNPTRARMYPEGPPQEHPERKQCG